MMVFTWLLTASVLAAAKGTQEGCVDGCTKEAGDTASLLQRRSADAMETEAPCQIRTLWYKPHYQCSGNASEAAKTWLQFMSEEYTPDFIGIAQLENTEYMSYLGQSYSPLGSACTETGSESYGDVVAIAYSNKRWKLLNVIPTQTDGQACPAFENGADPLVQCNSTIGNVSCCACTYAQPELVYQTGTRAFLAAKFEAVDDASKNVCVVAASLPHPTPNDCSTTGNAGQGSCDRDANGALYGTGELLDVLTSFCNQSNIIFMADTNLNYANNTVSSIFSDVVDFVEPPPKYTCCFDSPWTDHPYYNVSVWPGDRIATSCTGKICSSSVNGGSQMSNQTIGPNLLGTEQFNGMCGEMAPRSQGFPCCGSSQEHAPLLAEHQF